MADGVKAIRLRLPDDLHKVIVAQAEASRRSTHAQLLYLLELATGTSSQALRERKQRGRSTPESDESPDHAGK